MGKIIRDVIYKHIEVSTLAMEIIDTREFQRLRRIKQLSTAHQVYPSAQHTRFEHSIGVYHLTGIFLDQINIKLNTRLREIIKIAGLLHDIGHMAFSHTMDLFILPKIGLPVKSHEDRGIELIKHMNEKYDFGLCDYEVEIIQHCIEGIQYKQYPKYLFQIVANKDTGIDVDKMDYLLRDSYYFGNHNPFDLTYILKMSKIINNELYFDEKTIPQIYKMLNTRYDLHNEFYQHDVTLITQIMMADLILENQEFLDLKNIYKDLNWVKMTDEIVHSLPNKKILERIERRDFYKKKEYETGDKIMKKFSFNSVKDFFFKINFFDRKTKKRKVFNEIPQFFICPPSICYFFNVDKS